LHSKISDVNKKRESYKKCFTVSITKHTAPKKVTTKQRTTTIIATATTTTTTETEKKKKK